jgi:hypothetical protein
MKQNSPMPPQEERPLTLPEIYPNGKGRYEFGIGIGAPRIDDKQICHVVLPKYCYVDGDNFENNTQEDIIIVTRKCRQTIDCIFEEGKIKQPGSGSN